MEHSGFQPKTEAIQGIALQQTCHTTNQRYNLRKKIKNFRPHQYSLIVMEQPLKTQELQCAWSFLGRREWRPWGFRKGSREEVQHLVPHVHLEHSPFQQGDVSLSQVHHVKLSVSIINLRKLTLMVSIMLCFYDICQQLFVFTCTANPKEKSEK